MKHVEEFRWYMPPRTERGKPYLTNYHMDAATAAQRGALRPEPATRRVIAVTESVDELAVRLRETDAGARVTRPWWMPPEMIALPVLRVRWRWDMR